MPPRRNDPSGRGGVTLREKVNWLIHMQYVRQDYDACLTTIEDLLKVSVQPPGREAAHRAPRTPRSSPHTPPDAPHASGFVQDCRGLSEYPIYVKALIKRQRGEIAESLQLFQAATCLNPHNVANLKQVGRSLYLLGRHKAALDVYEEALKVGSEDWEIWHNKGLCCMYLKQYDNAVDCLKKANLIQRHDSTYMQLGKVYTLQEQYRTAIDVYVEALEFSPENPELLTTVGLLYLRLGENYKAFDFLGNSLTHDPKNPKTILAAGSIIQVTHREAHPP